MPSFITFMDVSLYEYCSFYCLVSSFTCRLMFYAKLSKKILKTYVLRRSTLSYNIVTPSYSIFLFLFFLVNFEKVNACWNDNDNKDDDNSHNEVVDRSDFTINLIQFFKLGGRGLRATAESQGPGPEETQDLNNTGFWNINRFKENL